MKQLLVTGFALVTLLLSGACYSQTEVHSGVLHTTSNGEEYNLVKLHCDALIDQTLADIITREYDKYRKDVPSVHIDAPHMKIYLKYTNSIDANMLLGILERVQIKAYYLDSNGNPVYYTKSGNENFIR